jgi:peptidoglycan/xylan/chitin deacetylase (PgdA/CDA1 family)
MKRGFPRMWLGLCLFMALASSLFAGGYVNPSVSAEPHKAALTFDLCEGAVDQELLALLWENQEPVTVFVTAKWIRKNPIAALWLKDKQAVFHIENHGGQHHQTVVAAPALYGLTPTRTPEQTLKEAEDGAVAIESTFGRQATWFRSAGAAWDTESVALLSSHWKLAGYTVNGDEGAKASKAHILSTLRRVKSGDVVLFHANHPHGETFEALREWLPSKNRVGLGVLAPKP